MNIDITPHLSPGYKVATPVFEGPLDLLLQLIERAELDITKLALAQVTDQFLAYMHDITDSDAEEVSTFLVIAAKLIQIKSQALLPRQPVHETGDDEEDPGEALARQLRTYKKFKEIAQMLSLREQSNLRTYLRLAPAPKVEGKIDFRGLTLTDLIEAACTAFSQQDDLSPLGTIVASPKITVREKITQIGQYLSRHRRGSFRQLLSKRPFRLDIVVTFLALLELMKRRLIYVNQDGLFSDIEIESNTEWDGEDAFELEFSDD